MANNLQFSLYYSPDNTKQKSLEKVLYLYVIFFISLYYAYTLSAIPMDDIVDRNNYLNYAESSSTIIERYNGLSFYFNEPIWLKLNEFLFNYLGSAEVVIQAYIFIFAFITSFLILNFNKKYIIYLITILLLWQVMTNYVYHLRQGVAIAIFLIGYFIQRPYIKYAMYLLAGFIHSSFFIILAIFIFSNFLKKIFINSYRKYIFEIILYIIISSSLFFLAHLIGARQNSEVYSATIKGVSGLGFLFWVIIAGLLLSETKKFRDQYSFQISILLFYLAGYFTSPVIARVFESGLIIILFAVIDLSLKKRILFFGLFSFYFFMQIEKTIEYFVLR